MPYVDHGAERPGVLRQIELSRDLDFAIEAWRMSQTPMPNKREAYRFLLRCGLWTLASAPRARAAIAAIREMGE